jgi:hypothetical protein
MYRNAIAEALGYVLDKLMRERGILHNVRPLLINAWPSMA